MSTNKSLSNAGKRRLRVYYKHFFRKYSITSVVFPEIRLCGKWLEEAGFECGAEINVNHNDGKIIITKSETGLEEQ